MFLDKMSLPNGVDVSQLVQHPVLAALPPFFLRASERYQVQKLVCVPFFIKEYFRKLDNGKSKCTFISNMINDPRSRKRLINNKYDIITFSRRTFN